MAAIAASIRAWPSKMKTSIQQLGQDYKRVAFDLAGFAKEKPLRFARNTSLFAGVAYLLDTTPTEKEYYGALTVASGAATLLSSAERNPEANEYLCRIENARAQQ
eukprot:gene19388-856_t